jgi:hypothetical protein
MLIRLRSTIERYAQAPVSMPNVVALTPSPSHVDSNRESASNNCRRSTGGSSSTRSRSW